MTFGSRRTSNNSATREAAESPGPNHYDVDKINSTGRYGITPKYKNTLSGRWNKKERITEFNRKSSLTPGPGSYDDGLDISKPSDR